MLPPPHMFCLLFKLQIVLLIKSFSFHLISPSPSDFTPVHRQPDGDAIFSELISLMMQKLDIIAESETRRQVSKDGCCESWTTIRGFVVSVDTMEGFIKETAACWSLLPEGSSCEESPT